MPNQYRGEVELDLDGKRYVLVPDFRAVAEIENRTGHSCLTLRRQIVLETVRVSDVAVVAWAGARSGDAAKAGDFEPFADSVLAAGAMLYPVLVAVAKFLENAVGGVKQVKDDPPAKDEKPRPRKAAKD